MAWRLDVKYGAVKNMWLTLAVGGSLEFVEEWLVENQLFVTHRAELNLLLFSWQLLEDLENGEISYSQYKSLYFQSTENTEQRI